MTGKRTKRDRDNRSEHLTNVCGEEQRISVGVEAFRVEWRSLQYNQVYDSKLPLATDGPKVRAGLIPMYQQC